MDGVDLRYLEDFAAGEVIELGSYEVTEEEIIGFAAQYDPQYFHTDPEAAKRSLFGGLVASGWHSCAIYMRLLVTGLLENTASLASPGVDQIRWLRPVRPGDRLHGRFTVLDVAPSQGRPERGRIIHSGELFNGQGETVLTLRAISLIGRRPPDPAG